jgi:hypothetical protein
MHTCERHINTCRMEREEVCEDPLKSALDCTTSRRKNSKRNQYKVKLKHIDKSGYTVVPECLKEYANRHCSMNLTDARLERPWKRRNECLHHEVKKTPHWTPEATREGPTCSVGGRNRSQASDLEVGADFCFDSLSLTLSVSHTNDVEG